MDLSYFILFLILVTVVFVLFSKIGNKNMTYIKSNIDNQYYMVRNYKDKQKAANLLAKLKENLYRINDSIYQKCTQGETNRTKRYSQFTPYSTQLNNRIRNIIIKESPENSVYTSYSVNKGEQIVFCIRSKAITNAIKSNNIHDINLVMYVALHEISHVACPEYDHTPLFKQIFHFICEEAINLGIYQKIDFNQTPKEYCGMTISESII